MANVYCIVSKHIKLSTPTGKTQLQEPLAYDNALSHAMQVVVYDDDGNEADLSGVGVTASMLRADGTTVTPINGTASGNVAQVILPASCYVVPGRFKFTMNLSSSSQVRSALWVEGFVERNISTDIVDPGTPVGNISTAISQANAAASEARSATTTAQNAATTANQAAQTAQAAADAIAIATVAETKEYLGIT